MTAGRDAKRLFVGGLGPSVSQADLQSQFSRFGDVSDVEIIARKDDQGNPQKVFAYVNISIAEADLKKCMSVLNKTKWKGGTLQIQLAKESFLHRLAREREEAKTKEEKTGNPLMLEKIGGVDFQMKGVPGTEVPGHKNWVVSKFGRVLPVLHLKNQHKHKIIKYDPSKYCHNLKKIGEDFTGVTPISNLTWELEGGDDPMSKKRRGEFSEFHSPPKKVVKVRQKESSKESQTDRPKPCPAVKSPHSTQKKAARKALSDPLASRSFHAPDSGTQKLKGVSFQNSGLETNKKKNNLSDDDTDSEEELRLMIAREEHLDRTTRSSASASESDLFEVVRDDFKSDVHRLHSSTGFSIRNNVSHLNGSDSVRRDDLNYESSDTDEIIAMKKNAGVATNCVELPQMENSRNKKTLGNGENSEPANHCVRVQKRKNSELVVRQEVKPLSRKSLTDSGNSENADSVSESAESEVDEEYNNMMKNCLRVNLTLTDLEQLTYKEETEDKNKEIATVFSRVSKGLRNRRCICPDEIVASLLAGEEDTCGKQKPKGNNLKPKFQAFKGIGCLYGKESPKHSLKENVTTDGTSEHQTSLRSENSSDTPVEKGPSCTNDSPGEQTHFLHAKRADDQLPKTQSALESQDFKVVSPASSKKGARNSLASPLSLKQKKSVGLCAKTLKTDSDKCYHETTETFDCDLSSPGTSEQSSLSSSKNHTQGSTTDFLTFSKSSSDMSVQHRPTEDNLRRLAALEARQKATALQKKLVQDALANVDGHPADKSTHIIFGSDTESEAEETSTQKQQSHSRSEPAKESSTRASGKLFDSSDDEGSGSEDDSNRFKIKPQFEGKAGQKLMSLQSQFGTDERFRMDSRFLESDSDEEQEEVNENKAAEDDELAAEKRRALDVVQSVLQVNLNNSASRGSVATKKFKDIIRYDPTRQDHAAYERKKDEKPKESKTKRKKKKEEAEKLPEVSKEMYYNIAMDLKEIFQATKDASYKEDCTPHDEHCGEESAEGVLHPVSPDDVSQQPGGFTFSFFDSEAEDVKEGTEAYRIDAVKPVKTAWQRAHFQDSSSEEEDATEDADHGKPSPEEVSLPEKETTRFFFFSKTDERLNGSILFWRGVGNDVSKTSWEARTDALRMDCRKKHKDAKRRVKPK